MKTFESLAAWQTFRAEQIHHDVTLGFVPTKGALHAGHMSLVRRAQTENDHTLVSIFVNPTQFNDQTDLEKYPRALDRDLAMLEAAGTDFVLLPGENEIYSDQKRFSVHESEISKLLCGAHRPGHFTGVLTVVLKLLGLAHCERCYMGEKDYQQFLLVREMAESFFLKTKVVSCATVREPSGLAMSSRNERLSRAARDRAALIYKTLCDVSSPAEARAQLAANGFEVEYLEDRWGRRFVAAWLEGVRLIDNIALGGAQP